ncbi:MAG: hypothetical protein JRD89_08825 [Deltaproteobacteria bacterium]|nr:hypothetical protein [Deltaproteobacteria bacterium]
MEAILYRVDYGSRSDVYKLYPLGDIHGGTIYCAEAKIKARVRAIEKDPYALWIGMGDYADLVTPHDPRWEWHIIADWVRPSNVAEDQCQWVEALFKPIRDKCVGLHSGNHEIAIRKFNHYDFMVNLTERLGVPYLGYSAFVRFIFSRSRGSRTTFLGHFTHGSGCPQTEGGKVMNLKRSFDGFDGDIYAKGHIHDIKVMDKPYLHVTKGDPPRIENRNKCGAITGCWFETYMQGVEASYGEQKSYSPTPVDCPVFTIEPDKGLVNVYSRASRMGVVEVPTGGSQ